jgi:hypothetical protein
MKQADCPRCNGSAVLSIPMPLAPGQVKQWFKLETCLDCDGTGIDPFVLRVFRDQATIEIAAALVKDGQTQHAIDVSCAIADALTLKRFPRKVAP